MRYRDATHVDLGSFYARRPWLGKAYRFIGLAALVVAFATPNRGDCLGLLMGCLILLWLAAWYQIVGTLWRATIVGAILITAIRLTMLACPACATCPLTGVAS